MRDMTDPSAQSRPARTGAVVSMVMTVFGACFTLVVLTVAVWFTASFAADDELYGSAWATLAALTVYALISGVATVYIARRGVRELRRVRGR
jgi:hypothetical protein